MHDDDDDDDAVIMCTHQSKMQFKAGCWTFGLWLFRNVIVSRHMRKWLKERDLY